MDLTRSDKEAWEDHLDRQVQSHKDRVRQLREEGLQRVGLGPGVHQQSTQEEIDLTSEHHLESQSTEEGLPTPHQESHPTNQAGEQESQATHHQGSQTEEAYVSGSQTIPCGDHHPAWEQMWLEGYEAARRVMK
eukprot:15691836-Heterocapsa_arctica.AAC.1